MSSVSTLSASLLREVAESVCRDRTSAVHSAVAESIVSKRQSLDDLNKLKAKLVVNQDLDVDEQDAMARFYPEYTFVFKVKVKDSHGFSAASRIAETRILYDRAGGSDVPIIDVGGNWSHHISQGRTNVHSCCPQIDLRDASRHVERMHNVTLMQRNTKPEVVTALEYFKVEPQRFVCINKAQNCKRVGTVLIAVHSIYDMSMKEFAAAMVSHEASIAYGCFCFTPSMLIEDRGHVPYYNYTYNITGDAFYEALNKNIGTQITFNFRNDSSNGYQHDFRNYLRWVLKTSVKYRRETFYYELLENRNGIQFFKMTRVHNVNLRETVITRNIDLTYLNDKLGVPVFSWDNVGSRRVTENLNSRIIFVDKVMVWRVMEYTMGLADRDFSRHSVFAYMKSLNNRMVVNGITVSLPDRLSFEDLNDLCTTIYIRCIFQKCNNSEVNNALINIRETYDKNKTRFAMTLMVGGAITSLFNKIDIFCTKNAWIEDFRRWLVDNSEAAKFLTEFSDSPMCISMTHLIRERVDTCYTILKYLDDEENLKDVDSRPEQISDLYPKPFQYLRQRTNNPAPSAPELFAKCESYKSATTPSDDKSQNDSSESEYTIDSQGLKYKYGYEKNFTNSSMTDFTLDSLGKCNRDDRHTNDETIYSDSEFGSLSTTICVNKLNMDIISPPAAFMNNVEKINENENDATNNIAIAKINSDVFEKSNKNADNENCDTASQYTDDDFSADMRARFNKLMNENCQDHNESEMIHLKHITNSGNFSTKEFRVADNDNCDNSSKIGNTQLKLGKILNETCDKNEEHEMIHLKRMAPAPPISGHSSSTDYMSLENIRKKKIIKPDNNINSDILESNHDANTREILEQWQKNMDQENALKKTSKLLHSIKYRASEAEIKLNADMLVTSMKGKSKEKNKQLKLVINQRPANSTGIEFLYTQAKKGILTALPTIKTVGSDIILGFEVMGEAAVDIMRDDGCVISQTMEYPNKNPKKLFNTNFSLGFGKPKEVIYATKRPLKNIKEHVAKSIVKPKPTESKAEKENRQVIEKEKPMLISEPLIPKLKKLMEKVKRDEGKSSIEMKEPFTLEEKIEVYFSKTDEVSEYDVHVDDSASNIQSVISTDSSDQFKLKPIIDHVSTVSSKRSTRASRKKKLNEYYKNANKLNKIDEQRSINRIDNYKRYLELEKQHQFEGLSEIWKKCVKPSGDFNMQAVARHINDGAYFLKQNVEGQFMLPQGCKPDYEGAYNGTTVIKINWNKQSGCYTSSVQVKGGFPLLVSKNTKLCQADRLLEIFNQFPIPSGNKCEITLVEGVPGCGKTYEIINSVSPGELVLTVSREANIDTKNRVKQMHAGTVDVQTVDSYLINNRRQYSKVFLDEGLMTHPGVIDIIIRYSNCDSMMVYGDRQQIPFVPRVPKFVMLEKIYSDFSIIESRHISRRCPQDVAAIFSSQYDRGFTTTSEITRSVQMKPIGNISGIPNNDDNVYLTFTQEEKSDLKKKNFKNVYTIHEAQGKTYPKVIGVRLRPQNVDIFKSNPHVLVMLTRHTQEFTYCTVSSGDRVSTMIRNGSTYNNLTKFFHAEAPIREPVIEKPTMMTEPLRNLITVPPIVNKQAHHLIQDFTNRSSREAR